MRPLYLYPMALSFIVTGTAWKWFLDPWHRVGTDRSRSWGWESFEFDWIKDRQMAIYTIVIAAVWQIVRLSSWPVFLAGLRGVDNEIIKCCAD